MKKALIIGGIILVTLGIGAGAYMYMNRSASDTVSPQSADASVSPTAAPKMLTWSDPAGFTFTYPDTVSLNKHDEDQVNYAHVELTNTGHPGNIIVWVKDVPPGVTTTASWVTKDASLSAGLLFDTTLGGQPAKQIIITSPQKREVTGAVYDGALFYIETFPGTDTYWKDIATDLTKSFAFQPVQDSSAASSQGAAASSGSADGEPAVDEEEVLQ
jgi:hypothetical protein